MTGEVVEVLGVRTAGRYVDGTLGDGGIARTILEASAPDGELLALDVDDDALARSREALSAYRTRFSAVRGNFERLPEFLAQAGWSEGADGIILDLGVSTLQLLEGTRGFSFAKDGPLDMRMDRRLPETAADLANQAAEKDLADMIYRYGEERASRRIARCIVERRRKQPLRTTADLRAAVLAAGLRGRPGHDPATRTFQAFRIAVNDELGVLERFLEAGWRCLRPGGRLAVLSYHSLEDRIVKRAFARWTAHCICPSETPICVCGWKPKAQYVLKRAKRASPAEVERNPRARSARLRAVERITVQGGLGA